MSHRNRVLAPAVLLAVTAGTLVACGAIGQGEAPPDGRQPPVARNAADCIASVGGVIRSAPASADDPGTGAWLGRIDHLRDQAKALGDVTSRQLAGELDWAGARVALDGFPPQLAIVPAKASCTIGYSLSHGAVHAAVIPATRAWLAAAPPLGRSGTTAGVVTKWREKIWPCPLPSHGSEVSVGNGCDAWVATLTTADGSVRVSCGDSATAAPCPDPVWSGLFNNSFDVGDELYVPAGGQVTRASDIAVISQPPWGAWETGIRKLIKQAEAAR